MTPIINVSDRERDLTAEREEYKTHAQRLMTTLLERTAEIDELRAELTNLKALVSDAAHTLEKARIWGGMDWHYNPLHPIHYTPMLKRLNEALAPLTMPKGHTREQIGLQLDDSREELTAHHVYCRVVTEDV